VYAAAAAGAPEPVVPSFDIAKDVASKVTRQGERKSTRQSSVARKRVPSPVKI
jgi:hypothetical protein